MAPLALYDTSRQRLVAVVDSVAEIEMTVVPHVAASGEIFHGGYRQVSEEEAKVLRETLRRDRG